MNKVTSDAYTPTPHLQAAEDRPIIELEESKRALALLATSLDPPGDGHRLAMQTNTLVLPAQDALDRQAPAERMLRIREWLSILATHVQACDQIIEAAHGG